MALRLTLADGQQPRAGQQQIPPVNQPAQYGYGVGGGPYTNTVIVPQGALRDLQGNASNAASGDTLVPEIGSSEITLLEVLGDGSYGTVYKGMCRQKLVAVKVLRGTIQEGMDRDPKTLESFRHEIGILSKIFHPNVCLFMGACTEPNRLMIVSELMKQDVDSLLSDPLVDLSMLQRMRIAKGAALGVLWLHSSNPQIIHRDLKPSNLLVDDMLNTKVCDFGLSELTARGSSVLDGEEGAKGTPLWMAPEVMRHESFDVRSDVYSFGLILWSLVTRSEPFIEFNNVQEFARAVCLDHFRPAVPDCDPTLQLLMTKCWDPVPDNRPPFSDVVVALDYIIVDTAMTDEVARRFWKSNFLQDSIVKWDNFVDAFVGAVEGGNSLPSSTAMGDTAQGASPSPDSDLRIKCLQHLLADTAGSGVASSLTVDIGKFGKFLAWFGPMESGFLGEVVNLLQEPWFHGDVSAEESETLLIGKDPGTFLVRFSTTSAGCFTVSKVSVVDGLIKHQKLQRIHQVEQVAGDTDTSTPRQFSHFEVSGGGLTGSTPPMGISDEPRRYSTLRELVQSEEQTLGLTVPCLGSKYVSLFVDTGARRGAGYIG